MKLLTGPSLVAVGAVLLTSCSALQPQVRGGWYYRQMFEEPPKIKKSKNAGDSTIKQADVSAGEEVAKEQLLVALVNEWDVMNLTSIAINIHTRKADEKVEAGGRADSKEERNGWNCELAGGESYSFPAGTMLVITLPIEDGARCVIPLHAELRVKSGKPISVPLSRTMPSALADAWVSSCNGVARDASKSDQNSRPPPGGGSVHVHARFRRGPPHNVA